jgi:hypothetical protein
MAFWFILGGIGTLILFLANVFGFIAVSALVIWTPFLVGLAIGIVWFLFFMGLAAIFAVISNLFK